MLKKKIHKSLLLISKRIESFFDFLKSLKSLKKKKFSSFKAIDKKIFLSIVLIIVLVISYFLAPVFYNKENLRTELENQAYKKYNLKVKLDQPIKYRLFPKPHFFSQNIKLIYNDNDIAKTETLKIFISIRNLFTFKSLDIKNLIFNKTNFNINSKNFIFFKSLLIPQNKNYDVEFIGGKFFYIDKNDDVIFVSNIKKLKYFFFSEKFLNKIESKINVFNIPINFDIENYYNTKQVLTKIKSFPLRLEINNNFSYEKQVLNGSLDLSIINNSKKISYSLNKDLINFSSNDDKTKGKIFFKPFFFSSDFKLSQLDIKKNFSNDSILLNIIKSEIFNNKNLNGLLTGYIQSLKGENSLKDIKFNLLLEEGNIIIQNLKTNWRSTIDINFSETELITNNESINFAGTVDLNFVDLSNFYSSFQINRKNRKKIEKIKFGFLFNFDERYIEINNLKIDGILRKDLSNFLNTFNSKKINILNKIAFRNSIKNFFRNF